jgi:hypothetical protein
MLEGVGGARGILTREATLRIWERLPAHLFRCSAGFGRSRAPQLDLGFAVPGFRIFRSTFDELIVPQGIW